MAILLMFYGIIIPKENLKKILTKKELEEVLFERTRDEKIWFDDYLYKEGSMSPADNERIIKFWESKGLVPIEMKNGKECWKDLCLIQYPDTEPTLPCDWIEIFYENNGGFSVYVNLKGKPKNNLVKKSAQIKEFFAD